ncbi:hypothetical protein ONZ27_000620 [Salmonella enterica subsp. enterica serovar Chandans]|nr:hypothetical protein [Salmonella enterica]EKB3328304.1 hypothetical protein [Salmonella enterica subsp. enterica serovar Chandans]EKH8499464.1 hypothetical protein [Salmonella enterica]
MRKYTAYRQGEERFDRELYGIMVYREQKAKQQPRATTFPPPTPEPVPKAREPETPPAICPLRQVMNIYREMEAEKERAKLERARRILAHKAETAARYLKKHE